MKKNKSAKLSELMNAFKNQCGVSDKDYYINFDGKCERIEEFICEAKLHGGSTAVFSINRPKSIRQAWEQFTESNRIFQQKVVKLTWHE